MKFWLQPFEGKETHLREALHRHGHTQAERIDDTDLLITDTDAPWAHPRPAMIEAAKQFGAKIALYPHGGLPYCWMYDGICDPDDRVDLRLEHGPGSLKLAELISLDLRQQATGWLYSPTRPFTPVEKPRKILFAPLHPIIEGLAQPGLNGHDPAPSLNQRIYKTLLRLGYQLTVSLVGPAHRSGIWPHPRATIAENHQMQFTHSYQQIMAADVVVAAGTVAAAAVACGKPVVMFGQENFQDYAEGAYPQAAHPELYRELIRYPLDADDGDIEELIAQACAGEGGAATWREWFIGDDGTDNAVHALEQLAESREHPAATETDEPTNVTIGGVTARATGQGG